MINRRLDTSIAAWVAITGALVLTGSWTGYSVAHGDISLLPVFELIKYAEVAGGYLYIIVLVVCLASVATRAVRRVSRRGDTDAA